MSRSWRLVTAAVLGGSLVLAPLTIAPGATSGLVTFGVVFGQSATQPRSTPVLLTAKPRAAQVGQIVSYGEVTINNRPAPTGSSIFNNSLIKVPCAAGSSAIIRIGNSAVIEIKPGAQLQLNISNSLIGGELREGSLRVRTQPGVRLALQTPDGLVSNDSQTEGFTPVVAGSTSKCQFDQLANVENSASTPQGQGTRRTGPTSQTTRAAAPASSLSPAALAALIFGVGVAGAITIVALTDSGYQISPINP